MRRACLIAVTTLACAIGVAAPAPAKTDYRPADQILVNHFVSQEAALLKIVPPEPVTVVEVNAPTVKGEINGKTVEAYMSTELNGAPGDPLGPVRSCTIRVGIIAHTPGVDPTKLPGKHNPPSKELGYISNTLKASFAHEVFHCLSARLAPSIAAFDKHKAWLIEGAATWVQSDLVPDNLDARDWWLEYLETPTTALFSRDNDAIGFFGHMAHSGISPWKAFPSMFAASSDAAAYNVGIASNLKFLDSEASAFFDESQYGTAWVPKGQDNATADGNVPSHHTADATAGPLARSTLTLPVKPYADAPDDLTLRAPVTELVVLSGNVRLRSTDGEKVDETDPGALTLCEPSHKTCGCPGTTMVFGRGDLAITGGSDGAMVELRGLPDCPAIPARSCSGLLSVFDFPGATMQENMDIAPLSFCVYADTTPMGDENPSVPPQPLVPGSFSLASLGDATMAHTFFAEQLAHCQGCSALAGVGDEAQTVSVSQAVQDTSVAGTEIFARIDNDIVTIAVFPANSSQARMLVDKVIGELLSTLQ